MSSTPSPAAPVAHLDLEALGIGRDFSSPMADLNGKAVLITGGTGSFGKAFVREVIKRWRPARLIIFSRDELKQYEMEQEFPTATYPFMRWFIGDVRDAERLRHVGGGEVRT